CAVLVKSSLRDSRILAHRVVPIEAEPPEGGGLAAALDTVRAELIGADTDCAVCVPASLFSCRNLQVPFANIQKIRMILPLELESHLPQAAAERLIDFTVVDSRSGDEPQTEVMAAAVERERLAPILEALAHTGIDPERITLSGLPVAVSIGRHQGPEEICLCADIGEGFGSITVLTADRIRLVRCVALPADPAARERAVAIHVRTILGALQETSDRPEALPRLFLTGDGTAGIERERLARSLPVELQSADLRPMLNLAPTEGEETEWDPMQMNGALALAMGEIEGLESLNFHRSGFPGRKLIARYRESLVRTGLLAAAVLVLMLAAVLTQAFVLKRQAAGLDARIAAVFTSTFPEVKSIVDPYRQMQAHLQELRKSTAAGSDGGAAFHSIEASGDGRLVQRKPSGSVPPGWEALESDAFSELKARLQADGGQGRARHPAGRLDRGDARAHHLAAEPDPAAASVGRPHRRLRRRARLRRRQPRCRTVAGRGRRGVRRIRARGAGRSRRGRPGAAPQPRRGARP
ncbi:MAG: hypothetical protein EHM15_13235, partial [Desulfobacteraceae bacterium]